MTHPVLRKLECFGALSDDDRALVCEVVAHEFAVHAQVDLICEGDDPSVVHLMTSGFACRYKRLADGKRQIVAFLIPGDFADPYAFILKTMDHGICTLTPSKVVRVSRDSILGMLERPALARSFFMAALADSATLREWIATIGQRSAVKRLAHLFCEMHARLDAVGLLGVDGIARVPITQTDLSDAVGLSLVHTNRSLRTLRDMGFVEFNRGNLRIIDALGLQEYCEFTDNYLHLSDYVTPERERRSGVSGPQVAKSQGLSEQLGL